MTDALLWMYLALMVVANMLSLATVALFFLETKRSGRRLFPSALTFGLSSCCF